MKPKILKYKKGDLFKHIDHFGKVEYFVVRECRSRGFCELAVAKATINKLDCKGLGLYALDKKDWISSCSNSQHHQEMKKLTEAEKMLMGY
jgi:hypothetical protein